MTTISQLDPYLFDLKQKRDIQSIDIQKYYASKTAIINALNNEIGYYQTRYVHEHINLSQRKNLLIYTKKNVYFDNPDNINTVINFKKINDIKHLNDYFRSLNKLLPDGGIYIGCVETYSGRKIKLYRRFPKKVAKLIWMFDYIYNRVIPRIKLFGKIYFCLTKGKCPAISKTEVLGRLVYNGFDIIEHKELIDNLMFFVVMKTSPPQTNGDPSYGPICKLKRLGKNGKLITIYKFRTMNPYAEYIQDYVYKMHHLQEGGKFRNDFRVSFIGRFLRKTWLDEFPMLLNLLKGNIKIVGVRPISKHYFSLYSQEHQQFRKKFKPGLLPPFYADNPKTLNEIEFSEKKYLESYLKSPIRTDINYFIQIVYNICVKKRRSA